MQKMLREYDPVFAKYSFEFEKITWGWSLVFLAFVTSNLVH